MAKKILVVGSFVMDQIAKTRIFPNEGETVFGDSFTKAPGGKGANQAVQAARLGADVTMIGKLGRDGNGTDMLNMAKDAGINTEYMLYDETTPSGCSIIVLEEVNGTTKNRIIVIPGSNMTIKLDEVKFIENIIDQYDMVMLQLEIPMEVNEYVAKVAYEHNIPVMLNSAPSAPLSNEFISHLSFISPNEHEAYDLTGVKIHNDENGLNLEDAKKAAQVLRDKGCKNVLITLGGSGAVVLEENGNFVHSPCVKGVNVQDPTAAGDSFVAAFCTASTEGMDLEKALYFANHTAAITVSRMGAMPSLPIREEVDKTL